MTLAARIRWDHRRNVVSSVGLCARLGQRVRNNDQLDESLLDYEASEQWREGRLCVQSESGLYRLLAAQALRIPMGKK